MHLFTYDLLLGMFLDDVYRYDNTLFADEVLGFGDVEGSEVAERKHTRSVKREEDTRLLDVGNGGGVETETDGFTGCQEAAIDSLGV